MDDEAHKAIVEDCKKQQLAGLRSIYERIQSFAKDLAEDGVIPAATAGRPSLNAARKSLGYDTLEDPAADFMGSLVVWWPTTRIGSQG
jgi:hypothetical protein